MYHSISQIISSRASDMNIQPFGAVIIGTCAGILSTLGYQYLTPFLRSVYLHDTCGVHNLHGLPGLFSGVVGVIVAFTASLDSYNGNRYRISTTIFKNLQQFNRFCIKAFTNSIHRAYQPSTQRSMFRWTWSSPNIRMVVLAEVQVSWFTSKLILL